MKPKRTDEEKLFARQQGMKIRAIRNRRGITQKQLVDFTGITADMVYRIERGEATASSFVVDAIAKALDVSRDELFPKNGEVIEINPTTARLLFLIEPRHFRRPAFA